MIALKLRLLCITIFALFATQGQGEDRFQLQRWVDKNTISCRINRNNSSTTLFIDIITPGLEYSNRYVFLKCLSNEFNEPIIVLGDLVSNEVIFVVGHGLPFPPVRNPPVARKFQNASSQEASNKRHRWTIKEGWVDC